MGEHCSKLAIKTETVSVSLMGNFNSVCLTYSSDDFLFKWHYYIMPLTIISFVLYIFFKLLCCRVICMFVCNLISHWQRFWKEKKYLWIRGFKSIMCFFVHIFQVTRLKLAFLYIYLYIYIYIYIYIYYIYIYNYIVLSYYILLYCILYMYYIFIYNMCCK